MVTAEQIHVIFIYVIQITSWVAVEAHCSAGSCLPWILRVSAALVTLFTYSNYLVWKDGFASRKPRRDSACPSNKRRPDTNKGQPGKKRWSRLPKLRQPSCILDLTSPKSLMSLMSRKQVEPPKSLDAASAGEEEPKERGTAEDISPVPSKVMPKLKRLGTVSNTLGELQDKKASGLNMDHIYMSLWDFLWCAWFVLPPMLLGCFCGGPCSSGLVGIVAARLCQKFGLYGQTTEAEAEGALIDFITSTSLVMWTTKIDTTDAVQLWLTLPDTTHIRKDGKVEIGSLSLHVDVTNRHVVSCTFHDRSVGKHDALALCFNAFAGHTHPLIHSYANWGIDAKSGNAFLRRMALVTIKYNNMGLESYPSTMEFFRKVGMAKYIGHDVSRLTCHMNHNAPSHALLRDLKDHVPFVAFMLKVRSYFMSKFIACQSDSDFDIIDGEALFLCTVMHSIDHRQAPYYIKIKHLQSNDPAFDADHEWAMFTLNCFVDRPPGRLFETRFSHAPHKLFRDTYEFAARIDPRLAGYMEACIAA